MEEKIAIIGIGIIAPESPNKESFWENVKKARNCISEVPKNRWDPDIYWSPDRKAKDKTYTKIGGFIKDFEFNPIKYKIPPTSAQQISRLQKLTLEAARMALEDSGYSHKDFDRDRTAVTVGNAMGAMRKEFTDLRVYKFFNEDLIKKTKVFSSLSKDEQEKIIEEYEEMIDASIIKITEDTMPGELSNITAGRVANIFNLRGPNMTFDAACASSLAAVDYAVLGLRSRKFDMAICGGADEMMSPAAYVKFCKIGALSDSGSWVFDERADGFVMAEAVAFMVLKRLPDALRDNDKIYALINAVGASSDGKGKGITAPNQAGQKLAIENAFSQVDYTPADVELIEAHGTATIAGDAAELSVLDDIFAKYQKKKQSIGLGSIKSQIGHTKAAAGAVSLVKTALALNEKILPPSINFSRPNKNIDFANSPFRVITQSEEWKTNKIRRANVSSFGFGGTNFHVAMEEYIPGRTKIYHKSAQQKEKTEIKEKEEPKKVKTKEEEYAEKYGIPVEKVNITKLEKGEVVPEKEQLTDEEVKTIIGEAKAKEKEEEVFKTGIALPEFKDTELYHVAAKAVDAIDKAEINKVSIKDIDTVTKELREALDRYEDKKALTVAQGKKVDLLFNELEKAKTKVKEPVKIEAEEKEEPKKVEEEVETEPTPKVKPVYLQEKAPEFVGDKEFSGDKAKRRNTYLLAKHLYEKNLTPQDLIYYQGSGRFPVDIQYKLDSNFNLSELQKAFNDIKEYGVEELTDKKYIPKIKEEEFFNYLDDLLYRSGKGDKYEQLKPETKPTTEKKSEAKSEEKPKEKPKKAKPKKPRLVERVAEIRKATEKARQKRLEERMQELKEEGYKGTQPGGIKKDELTGEVYGRYGRVSNNPKWYRDFYDRWGKAPTKADRREIALEHLRKGHEEDYGIIPPDTNFIALEKQIEAFEIVEGMLEDIEIDTDAQRTLDKVNKKLDKLERQLGKHKETNKELREEIKSLKKEIQQQKKELKVEKPKPEEAPSNLINSGLYILEPNVAELVPEGKVSIEREIFPRLATSGRLYGFPFNGQWFPTDNLERYERAIMNWKGIKP